MAKIDRLLIQARNINSPDFLSLSFIEAVEDYFILSAHLWDGMPFSGVAILKSVHPTKEEAILKLDELEKEYPVRRNTMIAFENIEGEVL